VTYGPRALVDVELLLLGMAGAATREVPMTDEERTRRVLLWLDQDYDSLSEFDRRRVDGIRYVLERARRRAETGGKN